jgi:16S rRNA C967 or C1407 C5-methylase (RsmB/RsmF family)/NOL1/NOP2/fmu family ribosome biogenesis protein
MEQKLGSDFQTFAACLLSPSPTSIRLNANKNKSLLREDPVLWSIYGKYLETRPSFTLDPHFHAGTYYVQEASSMFLEQVFRQVVDLDQPLNVLDLSAAPGGKSTHILSLINKTSLLVSNEVIRSRASVLAENIKKWGHPNSVITNNDPKDFQSLPGFFDVMVIDAPCSGEGLFRKDHEAINEWSPDNVALCAGRQRRILADVWPTLKENGIFIYCTCTYNEQENEDNLLWLQQEHDVEFLKLNVDPAWGIEEISKQDVIGYRFFPHRVRGEGFFISVMRKKTSTHTLRLKIKKSLTQATKKSAAAVQSWVHNPESFEFLQHNEFMYVFPTEKMHEAEILRQQLKLINIGTTIASVKHDKFIPEHALAMSIDLQHENFNRIELSFEDAIRYLRREVFPLQETSKGYALITFEDIPLGWINNLGNRFNSLYPLEWRIRMNA